MVSLLDPRQDLTFSQLITRYNDDSMFSASFPDNSSFDNSSIYQSNFEDDTNYTQNRDDNNVAITESTEPMIIQNLRTYLEKECFSKTEWSSGLLFNASTNKVNYQVMDITKYVGNSKFKKSREGEDFRVYFDPNKYPIEDKNIKETTQQKNCPLLILYYENKGKIGIIFRT